MLNFVSLKDFLLLKDPFDDYGAFLHSTSYPAYQWVQLYDLAKESFEKYGNNGPPIGSKVITLRPGHGGCEGSIRIFNGIDDGDKRFFVISRSENKLTSLVYKDFWWAELYHLDKDLPQETIQKLKSVTKNYFFNQI